MDHAWRLRNGRHVVVHHTFEEINEERIRIRIFSSRKGTRREIRHYSEES